MERDRDEQSSGLLQALPEDARRLWDDAGERHHALEAIVLAWRLDRSDLAALIHRVDQAVTLGLAACGLPRGPVIEVRIEAGWTPWRGRKTPGCELLLSAVHLQELIEEASSDDVFRAWIHESLHARQPFALGSRAEYRDHRGYEEGLVEGLTRQVTSQLANITPRDQPFSYWVAVYAALAEIIGVRVNALWRSLWTYPAGDVRSHFVEVVERLRFASGHAGLSGRQVALLQLRADSMFDSRRVDYTVDERAISQAWKDVFP
jgi:hypothetical protein